tara:strand:- start:382 stop:633 length:252 start_codon:yes stop_codon:yes gene_type:complete
MGRDNLKYKQRPLTYHSIEFNRYKGKNVGFKPSHDEIEKAVESFLAKGGSIEKSELGANPTLDNDEKPLSEEEIQNILEEWKI